MLKGGIRRKWLVFFVLLILLAGAFTYWPSPDNGMNLPKKVDYNYHIRPILSQNCFTCHGNDASSREANLRLDNFEGATKKSNNGAAIVPKRISKSLLIDRVTSDDPQYQMPPPESKNSLTQREVALLKLWIKQGAPYAQHWSFVQPESTKLPQAVTSTSEAIDYFISEKQKEFQFKLSERADQNTLTRRVAYLLTGLPPLPEEVDYFEDKEIEVVIDHYLASPAFGERWARHWMDLVRYGNTMGHEWDIDISASWEYRDYLIRAFNEDVPYDILVKEHIAGDMIENPRSNSIEGYNESIIGTSYFFLGEGKHSPVDIKEEESDRIDNMIDVTSKTFQSLTVACARCHDHKFDPIPTTDYYAMYGMFESSRFVPKQARQPVDQAASLKSLKTLKSKIVNEVGRILLTELDDTLTDTEIQRIQRFVKSQESKSTPSDTSLIVLADFRKGRWDGWYTDGIAFGEGPVPGELIIDSDSDDVYTLLNGFASSRFYASGLQGVLQSPNFTLESDSIAIRARGHKGTIRLIVENFQIIQYPLWGGLMTEVDSDDWKTYVLHVGLAKGHKAYLEFLPGVFENHQYRIQPDDYIEIQYAAGFNGDHPIRTRILANTDEDLSIPSLSESVRAWSDGRASPSQTHFLSGVLNTYGHRLTNDIIDEGLEEYRRLARSQFDSTHFMGVSEGQEILSPVFNRGSHHNLSEEKVPHRFLSAIDSDSSAFPSSGSGRLAWAEAVANPQNPLTARIMVNRIWHHIFGRGVVETVDNFGIQGMYPSHPALLDYLALKFMEEGWSIKSMIKHIMMSRTFAQSTTANVAYQSQDPNNIYLHHFPVRRLEAESIRDAILSVSGCIDRQMYGEAVPVYITEFMTGRGRPSESGPIDGFGRRSIYLSVRRNFLSPMMLAFDMPIPFSTFGKRNTTNVPAQSLTLLNDPFVHEQAKYWAENLLKQNPQTLEEGIDQIYMTAFSRQASSDEVAAGREFLENQAKQHGILTDEIKDQPDIWKEYCHSIINLKEFIYLL